MFGLRRFILSILVMAFVVVGASPVARAQGASQAVSFEEFKALATELAPKVNLFRDVWAVDPKAEFFGGTSRDYLYWLKGRLAKAAKKNELAKELAALRAREAIDVREFILFESDVDVVSKSALTISAERFDPKTEAGKNELNQGFIPAEKIRLGKSGVVATHAFGDGVREIYESRLTVTFAPEAQFWKTHYAAKGINHPVLLALRYLRLVGVDYYQAEGRGVPDTEKVLARMPESERLEVARVINEALEDSRLSEMMKNEKFVGWMNSANAKAFRSYTNPDAARFLFEHFRADLLSKVFGSLDPLNQTLFTANRDHAKVQANFARFKVDPATVLLPTRQAFPDGRLYHGTRDEASFRSILFQGILPSSNGSGGAGLYGVANTNVDFAAKWGGSEDRVVLMKVADDARIVDIRSGAGAELFEQWTTARRKQGDFEGFAEAFGFDILLYPYSTEAFVVKNAAVLSRPDGYKRKLMPLDSLRTYLAKPDTKLDLQKFVMAVLDNGLATPEIELLLKNPAIASRVNLNLPFDQMMELVSGAYFKGASLEFRHRARAVVLELPAVKEFLRRYLAATLGEISFAKFDPAFVKRAKTFWSSQEFRAIADDGVADTAAKFVVEEVMRDLHGKSEAELKDLIVKAAARNNEFQMSALVEEVARRSGSKLGVIWHSLRSDTPGDVKEDVYNVLAWMKTMDEAFLLRLAKEAKHGEAVERYAYEQEEFFETAKGRKLLDTVASRSLEGLLQAVGIITDGETWTKKHDYLVEKLRTTDVERAKRQLNESVAYEITPIFGLIVLKGPPEAKATLPILYELAGHFFEANSQPMRAMVKMAPQVARARRVARPPTCRALFGGAA